MKSVRILLWLPLAGFALVLLLVTTGLIRPHDSSIASRMVGRPLPDFTLPVATPGAAPLRTRDFEDGRPRLINFFASWCIPCAAEAPQLMTLRQAGVPIVGIALRDRPNDTAGFLQRNGDPYARIAHDDSASTQVAMGSSGVPETFVIDGQGRIRLQHIGAIAPEDVPAILSALQDAR